MTALCDACALDIQPPDYCPQCALDGMREKYEALVEAASQMLLDIEAGPARNLEALKPRRSALKAALDALEE
jgi:hypothetical protein